jgi:hypothetical protein
MKRGQTRGAKVNFWKRITNAYKTDASGEISTEKVVGRFKAVIEVESKESKKQYMEDKMKMIDDLVTGLRDLAKNRDIKDFNLDIEKLASQEGRMDIKKSLDPLGVNHLGIVKKLVAIQSEEILKQLLLQPEKQIVRIYMISGFDLASRDMGGFSDPYLIIKLGNKKFNERKDY